MALPPLMLPDAYSLLDQVPEPSNFWGSPVLTWDKEVPGPGGIGRGELYCPGYSGLTFARARRDKVFIGVPFGSAGFCDQPYTPGICTVAVDKGRDYDQKKAPGTDGATLTTTGIKPGNVTIKISIWTPEQLRQLEFLLATIIPGQTTTEKKVSKKDVKERGSTRTTARSNGSTTTSRVVGQGNAQSGSTEKFETERNFSTETVPTTDYRPAGLETTTTLIQKNQAQPFDVAHPDLEMHKVGSLYFLRAEGPTPDGQPGVRSVTLHCIEYMPASKNKTSVAFTAGASAHPAKPSTLERPMQPPGRNPRNTDP